MPDAVVATPLQDVDEPHEVGVDVGMGVFQRVSDPGLRGEIGHRIGPLPLEERCNRRGVRDVGAHVAKPGETP